MEPTAPRAIRDNARESGRAADYVFAGQPVTFGGNWVWRIQWERSRIVAPVLSYRGFVGRGGEHGVIAIL